MKSLDQLGIDHQTDKASQFTRTYAQPHDYLRHMEKCFEPLRNQPIKLLEIGVGGGESIRTWLEYFPHAQIFGVDIVHSTNQWNTPRSGAHPRYTFAHGDQSSDFFWVGFLAAHGGNWDVLVDDGGHASNQIITTWKMMWPHVASGGYYCIEDLNTAYSNLPMFVPAGWQNHMDFVKDKLDLINHDQGEIESLQFSRELAIFKKR